MKKQLLTLVIGIIIGTTITATAAYIYTANDIGYQPSDSEWEVGNAREALDSLKTDLNTVNTNVTEYKENIVEALANKGVEVTNTSTMEEIQNSINLMKASSRDIRLDFGSIEDDYIMTTSGHVQSNSKLVNSEKTRLEILGSCGPSGVSWMGYVNLVSPQAVDLTNFDSIMLSGVGYGTHASSYSNTTYLQIYLERVTDGEKFYLVNHVDRSQANYTWDNKYYDISSLNGEYKLVIYLSDEDRRGPSYVDITKIIAFNLN